MCTFITLIAATEDEDAINAILSRFDTRTHKRRAERRETQKITPVLQAGETEYLLIRNSCDCGTFLGHETWAATDLAKNDANLIARYRRQGWSEAKIARAIQNRADARTRPHAAQHDEGAAYWCTILTSICDDLALRGVGLMHDFDRLPRGEIAPPAPRRDGGLIAAAAPVFAAMEEGVVYEFWCVPLPVFT